MDRSGQSQINLIYLSNNCQKLYTKVTKYRSQPFVPISQRLTKQRLHNYNRLTHSLLPVLIVPQSTLLHFLGIFLGLLNEHLLCQVDDVAIRDHLQRGKVRRSIFHDSTLLRLLCLFRYRNRIY